MARGTKLEQKLATPKKRKPYIGEYRHYKKWTVVEKYTNGYDIASELFIDTRKDTIDKQK